MRLSSFARLAGLLVLASCISPADTDQVVGPLSMSVVSGDNQSGPPGTELPNPLVVLVVDSRAHAVKGQVINFRVVSGGGSVFAGVAITGSDGIAQERWTLGLSGPQRVEARAIDNATGEKLTFAIFTATLTDVQPPVVTDVATAPADPVSGSPFDLTAVVNDAATGGSNIAGATYAVDGGPPVAMVAQDGAFDEPSEAVRATVPPFATGGSHNFCVTGRDAAGNVSSPSCITVVVAQADVAPPVVTDVVTSPANPTAGSPFDLTAVVNDASTGGSNIAGATYTVDGGEPVAMFAQDGEFNQPTEAVRAHVAPFASGGSHSFCVTGRDAAGNVSTPSCITVVVAEDAVYVSPAGDDAANGTRAAPLKTIGAALALAGVSGKDRVNVAQGTYPENVQLRSGISLFGGYDPATWTRAPATFITTIGPGPASLAVAVQGDNVTGVTVDGFTIRSGDAVGPQASAYGMLFTNSVATISGNHILAGNGAAGGDGFTGVAGQNGVAGLDGEPGSANGPEGAGGFGTVLLCFGTPLRGGTGGQGGPPGATGQNGDPGNAPNGGNGGAGGLGGATPPLPAGENGQDGLAGITGAAGSGGESFGGISIFGAYIAANGSAGVFGQHGGSGGGGGGGGGLDPSGGGNGGGSGGTGGCAGSGGGGGGGAGGSFGIVGVASTLTVTGNTIETGNGGAGGAAGDGAPGGAGAAGGLGATNDAPQVGAGGNGGAGGAAGAGGAGGGGGGGPSVGIVSQGGSLAQAGNVFVLGNGGAGGASPGGNAGTNGLRTQIR